MPQNSLFNLKIMKLFLLNTMENKKSRKIGLTILGFFYNFLEFIWLWKKKKRKNQQQYWANFSPVSPGLRGIAPARAGYFAEKPSVFRLTRNGFFHYFLESLTLCRRVLRFLFLRRGRSPTASSAGKLRRAPVPAERGNG